MINDTTRSASAVLLAIAVASCSSSDDGGSPPDPIPMAPDNTGVPDVPIPPDMMGTTDPDTSMPDPVDPVGGGLVDRHYEVELINLTDGQTFSEPVLVLHPGADSFWQIGEPASDALERLAESGASDGISTLADDGSYAVVGAEASVAPGGAQIATISTSSTDHDVLTILTRMESTDDGFTGVNAAELSALSEVGQSMTIDRWALDSGTEKNLESTNLGSFGAARPSEPNDVAGSEFNRVTVHPGVVTENEPTPDNTSQLIGSRRFDNPVIRIRITRVEG